jgi:sterol desaturase/sphingolipid hydroxylase (fatty acid hydroxylase superfamily)
MRQLPAASNTVLQHERSRAGAARVSMAQISQRDVLAGELPGWLSGGLVVAALAGLEWYETRCPLRRRTEGRLRRSLRNLIMTALAGTALRIAEKPVTDALTACVHRKRMGLLKLRPLPQWFEISCSVVLLDYGLYVWHVLTHKLPPLWRFHRVHHLDRDLDVSTALRFHFGEMLLSVPWRAAQIALTGVSRLPLSIWQTLTVLAVMFHHSNARLPLRFERALSYLVMTPRMHGIHHSIVDSERNSNWSTIFSFPDYLHGTRRFDVPQEAITIGVPEDVPETGARRPPPPTLGRLLAEPWVAREHAGAGPDQRGAS